jgi:acetyl-CoA synthetase
MTNPSPAAASAQDRHARLKLVRDPARPGQWRIVIPPRANIYADTVGRHAAGAAADRVALVHEAAVGGTASLTYAELDRRARAFAAGLAAIGVGRGDRVAVQLGQTGEAAIGHLATHALGAVVVTVSQLYGPGTVAHTSASPANRCC